MTDTASDLWQIEFLSNGEWFTPRLEKAHQWTLKDKDYRLWMNHSKEVPAMPLKEILELISFHLVDEPFPHGEVIQSLRNLLRHSPEYIRLRNITTQETIPVGYLHEA